jgi:hypothetical protein
MRVPFLAPLHKLPNVTLSSRLTREEALRPEGAALRVAGLVEQVVRPE